MYIKYTAKSINVKQKNFFEIQKITFISYLLKTIDVFCQFIAEGPSKYFSFSIPLFLYCECLYQVLDYSIFHGYPVKKNIFIKTIEIFPLPLFEGRSEVLDFDFVINFLQYVIKIKEETWLFTGNYFFIQFVSRSV